MTTSSRLLQKRRAAAERDARWSAATGSGPARPDQPVPVFAGATSMFALFGEVLLVGVLVTAASLPVITLPAALAAGVRHLRRYVQAVDTRPIHFWRDLRASLLGGVGVGTVTVLAVVVCLFDIGLAGSDPTAVGMVMRYVGVAGLGVVATALMIAASLWSPERGWSHAVAGVRGWLDRDPAGVGYLLLTAASVVLFTWQLTPLIVPALGCAALAIVAIPVRPRRGQRSYPPAR